ncbi:L-fucose permease Glucose/galactose transporter [Asimina triloba]
MAIFLHFGMNTFTDSEWGTGRADPSLFDPGPTFNASQWARVAKDAGFSRIILTAKHHDGFCLWPSAYTNYSVAASPWRGGMGDVVGDVTAAAREVGIGVGIYLSPWDRHEASYGMTLEYNEFYLGQLTELLTRIAWAFYYMKLKFESANILNLSSYGMGEKKLMLKAQVTLLLKKIFLDRSFL